MCILQDFLTESKLSVITLLMSNFGIKWYHVLNNQYYLNIYLSLFFSQFLSYKKIICLSTFHFLCVCESNESFSVPFQEDPLCLTILESLMICEDSIANSSNLQMFKISLLPGREGGITDSCIIMISSLNICRLCGQHFYSEYLFIVIIISPVTGCGWRVTA